MRSRGQRSHCAHARPPCARTAVVRVHSAAAPMGKKKEGIKRVGATKPPRNKTHRTAPPPVPKAKLVGKKKHREAANAAAWALIGSDTKPVSQKKKTKFSY
eukprot:4185673-Prymnesium_polylepis.2